MSANNRQRRAGVAWVASERLGKVQPILIAGGGIGGLSAALALSRVGAEVLVLERASEFREVGAGIQLGPNAFHALDWLGLGEAARRRAVFIDSLRMMDAVTAEEICLVPVGEAFRQRFANPYAVVHRGELHAELLQACREIAPCLLAHPC